MGKQVMGNGEAGNEKWVMGNELPIPHPPLPITPHPLPIPHPPNKETTPT